jgi:peptidyl-dipeptidase A
MSAKRSRARLSRCGSYPCGWPLAVIGVFGLAGCSGEGPPAAPSTEPAATPDAALEFVTSAENDVAARSEQLGRVAWVYNNFITYDTERLLERARAESIEADVLLANSAARFADVDVDPQTRRKLDQLRLGLTLPAPQSEGAAEELAQITTRLASTYSKGRIDLDGVSTTLDDLEVQMREVRDPAKLEEMWTKWREVSKPMAADYARMVEVANAGARDLGFEDVGRMWLAKYDMPADAMAATVDRLWSEVRPLYDELYCHVRAELNEHYGDSIVPLYQPLRADLLGNMWAQDWSALADLVGPPESDPGYDVTELLAEQSYDAEGIVRAGERFYTSLGLPALPDTFWERSLLTRPADREVVCHASAWDIDSRDDIRIKMCIRVNGDDFNVVHHELGHNYYQRAYQEQSPLFRSGAHDGFHEAIGDFIALNVTPEYLVQIGLLPPERLPSAQSDLSLLMRVALDKIAFLPFAYTMDQWRWSVFSGEVTPATYNDAWWALVLRNQGVRPPNDRSDDSFDPGAKFHIANNVPYLRYFLAYILQFQFYEAACKAAGWEGPLHRCSLYGNREVGRHFNEMLAMGASKPWPDALETFIGSREMNGSALVAYFEPLMAWLKQQNAGRQCGW